MDSWDLYRYPLRDRQMTVQVAIVLSLGKQPNDDLRSQKVPVPGTDPHCTSIAHNTTYISTSISRAQWR